MIEWQQFTDYILKNTKFDSEFIYVNNMTYAINKFILSKCTDIFNNKLIYKIDVLDIFKINFYNYVHSSKIKNENKLIEGITFSLHMVFKNVQINFINTPGVGISNSITYYGAINKLKLNSMITNIEYANILTNILKQFFSTVSGVLTYTLPNGTISTTQWNGLT